MKKIVVALMALVMVFSLVACGEKEKEKVEDIISGVEGTASELLEEAKDELEKLEGGAKEELEKLEDDAEELKEKITGEDDAE